jgi:hypothetical protein
VQSANALFDYVMLKSQALQMKPKDFYRLQLLFYVSDASSYSSLKRLFFVDNQGRSYIGRPAARQLLDELETEFPD